jgi:predicted nucleic acid-binding protein
MPQRALGICWIVLGEFWQGAVQAGHEPEVVEEFLALGIKIMDPNPVVPVYARLCAQMIEADNPRFRTIGQNDLWIAAVALTWDRPLVSSNRRHFECVVPSR